MGLVRVERLDFYETYEAFVMLCSSSASFGAFVVNLRSIRLGRFTLALHRKDFSEGVE